MIYGIKGVGVTDGDYFEVRSDMGDAIDFNLAGEIYVPRGVGKWGRNEELGLDTLDVPPETLTRLARQSVTCD
jgi:hypothetical protein